MEKTTQELAFRSEATNLIVRSVTVTDGLCHVQVEFTALGLVVGDIRVYKIDDNRVYVDFDSRFDGCPTYPNFVAFIPNCMKFKVFCDILFEELEPYHSTMRAFLDKNPDQDRF